MAEPDDEIDEEGVEKSDATPDPAHPREGVDPGLSSSHDGEIGPDADEEPDPPHHPKPWVPASAGMSGVKEESEPEPGTAETDQELTGATPDPGHPRESGDPGLSGSQNEEFGHGADEELDPRRHPIPSVPASAAMGGDEEESEPEPAPAPPPHRKRGQLLRRLVLFVLLITVVAPLLAVVVTRFTPPLMTPLMGIRLAEGRGWDYRWRPLSEISPNLVQAVVAAEDARFCSHHGFDFEAMKKAIAHNERRPNKVRGGSTISQQTAKNVFLWPARSYVRKGLEAYFTILTETVWGKRRIMETYLNVVEWGPGIYGAQAAAERYFGVDAAELTPSQASRLAAILPSPLKWKAVHPGRYVARRSRKITAASGTVRADGLATCVYR